MLPGILNQVNEILPFRRTSLPIVPHCSQAYIAQIDLRLYLRFMQKKCHESFCFPILTNN